MSEYNFSLSQKEAEMLINALQTQTNDIIEKMQTQFAMQVQSYGQEENKEEILLEEDSVEIEKGDE